MHLTQYVNAQKNVRLLILWSSHYSPKNNVYFFVKFDVISDY